METLGRRHKRKPFATLFVDVCQTTEQRAFINTGAMCNIKDLHMYRIMKSERTELHVNHSGRASMNIWPVASRNDRTTKSQNNIQQDTERTGQTTKASNQHIKS